MKLKTRQECADAMTSKGALAEKLYGHLVYDTALPQSLLDDVDEVTGNYLAAELVFWYPEGMIMGMALPLTVEAAQLLVQYTFEREHGHVYMLSAWKDAGMEEEDLDHLWNVVEEIKAGYERGATGD